MECEKENGCRSIEIVGNLERQKEVKKEKGKEIGFLIHFGSHTVLQYSSLGRQWTLSLQYMYILTTRKGT